MNKINFEKENNTGTTNLSTKTKHCTPFFVKYDNSRCLLAAGGGGGAWSIINQSKEI